jgi:3D (Asp-Asp-Asp) domain-containing protein
VALAGVAVSATLPSAGAADTAATLRARAAQLEAGQATLQRTEHGALLALYAAEAELARAGADLDRLDARAAELSRLEASLDRRADSVRRTLAASQRRIEQVLRVLYVEGDADPIAALLGATSLDDASAAIDSLEQVAAQNARLADEARAYAVQLAGLRAELEVRRMRLDEARTAASAAAVRLRQATAERRLTVASVQQRSARASARIDALLAQARAAEQASERLTRAARASRPSARTEAAPATAPEPTTTPAPSGAGTRTLVVDAVAYHLPGHTASGLPVGVGVVAVDPNVIPLGTRMFIPGYGPGIAADVGSAIKGTVIDLWMPSTAAARRWGRRTVTITIYG